MFSSWVCSLSPQDKPDVLCSALGLCVTQQEAFAKAQLVSNEIPELDLTQRVSPLLLNIPHLLYPKENADKKETTTKVSLLSVCHSLFSLGFVFRLHPHTNPAFYRRTARCVTTV